MFWKTLFVIQPAILLNSSTHDVAETVEITGGLNTGNHWGNQADECNKQSATIMQPEEHT